ncbi:MAG: type I methionyl aminopeptidase [Chloroflexi bacterium]|nr:type I methionyl aminopeptidase [Chloroflexota bacterium]
MRLTSLPSGGVWRSPQKGGIVIKSPSEIAIMREAGRVVAEVLAVLREHVRPGLATGDLEEVVVREFRARGAIPSFKGYHGFPASLCVSVNQEVVHGIPGKRVLQEGDLVSLDLGAIYKGFQGDAAITLGVGKIGHQAQSLLMITKEALAVGIKAVRDGGHVGDVSWAIQSFVESNGFSVVREYAGHGIGREMHEEPQVPNFGLPGKGVVLRKGMVLAIEPMVNVGDWRTRVLDDGWTVVSADGSLSAHFEHTVVIGEIGTEILTEA